MKSTHLSVTLDALDHLATTLPERRPEVEAALRALGEWHDHDPEADCPADCPTLRHATSEWETVTADQVQVGDVIEIRREWPEGSFTATGTVTEIRNGLVFIGNRHGYTLDDTSGLHTSSTIRRKVRPPMPEPEAPAVVRHAGQIWVRQEMHDDAANGAYWWPLSLDGGNHASEWRTWSQVLALDPTMDPVVVDLGWGAS